MNSVHCYCKAISQKIARFFAPFREILPCDNLVTLCSTALLASISSQPNTQERFPGNLHDRQWISFTTFERIFAKCYQRPVFSLLPSQNLRALYQYGKSGIANKLSPLGHLSPHEKKAIIGGDTYIQYINHEGFTMVDSSTEKL